jgi:hypothetical protein
MLYTSLAASLFSAFLAMLGKQWLNRYASTYIRGTAIERSQDRQRKLRGIVTWYFDYVMESLPLMLQFALLLLGCALSLYLWGINVTIACVILGVTALGVIFYVFAVVAGTASASCPYQTPGARILRHIHHHALRNILYHILPPIFGALYPAFRGLIYKSRCLVRFSGDEWCGWRNWKRNISVLFKHVLCFPFRLAYSVYRLARSMVRAFIALACRVRSWIRSARSARARRSDQRTAALDSQCISWILQTSLETSIRLSTLKFLVTTPTLADFTPALVSDCFDILIDCLKVNKRNPVIVQGMEQLEEVSAMCFFLAYSHLSIMDPTPRTLVGIHQRYRRIFPPDLDFSGLSSPHTLGTIHEAIYSDREVKAPIEWRSHKPTNHEHITVARALSKLSWSEYRRRKLGQVPPPCLSFALHYLSQNPLPLPLVVADCLLIIAIDLGCNVPNTMVLGERYVHVRWIPTILLTKTQCTTRGDFRPDNTGTRYRDRHSTTISTRAEVRGYSFALLVCGSTGAIWGYGTFRYDPKSYKAGKPWMALA